MGTNHRIIRSLEDRFVDKVSIGDGCWEWLAAKNNRGYGVLYRGGKPSHMTYAHRVSYEAFVGPIPAGLQIDHLCNNKACVKPSHLKPVTGRENVLRSETAPTAVNAAKTECIHGHLFDEVNTYVDKRGRRHCRACSKLSERRRKQRRLREGAA